MVDREKTALGIREMLMRDTWRDIDANRPRYQHILNDALALLKEQEAVTIKRTKENVFGVYGGICPKCHSWVQSVHSFCGFCGQAVKWE